VRKKFHIANYFAMVRSKQGSDAESTTLQENFDDEFYFTAAVIVAFGTLTPVRLFARPLLRRSGSTTGTE
jgi:hypothetical protein